MKMLLCHSFMISTKLQGYLMVTMVKVCHKFVNDLCSNVLHIHLKPMVRILIIKTVNYILTACLKY